MEFTPLRFRVNESAFFFVRQLVAGKVKGFEDYKVDKQNQQWAIPSDAFLVNDKLYEAFRSYTLASKDSGLSAQTLAAQADYARMRIRVELATANYSSEAGVQVLLENDPQVLKAAEAVISAKGMAEQNLAMH